MMERSSHTNDTYNELHDGFLFHTNLVHDDRVFYMVSILVSRHVNRAQFVYRACNIYD